MVGYYLAGQETTANTSCWIVKYLSQNPEVQGKLRTALRAAHTTAFEKGRQPTAKEILQAKTPYLLAVIDEVLRLQPPFGLIDREALTDTVVLGHPVPKGTVVFMSSLGPSLHTPALPLQEHLRSDGSQAKKWDRDWAPDDIHLFKPERWLTVDEEEEVTHDPQAGPLLSFGLGPRQCFGKRLGYLQLRILTTLFVWNFEFESLDAPLSSFESIELNVRQPRYCFVKLQDAQY
jgi:cytochrome P450